MRPYICQMNESFLGRELLPFALFIIFILVGSIFSAKKRRKVFSKLTSYLPGALSKFPLDPSYKGTYQGLSFSIALLGGGKNSPPYLKILLKRTSTFRLSLYKESALSDLGKNMGVVREVKVFDEAFDKEFLIFSNKPDRAISYFSNSEIKNAVRELFGLGFNSLIIDHKGLKIKKTNYNLNIDLEPQRIVNIMQKLSILARGCN